MKFPFDEYLSGRRLYGDDLNQEEIVSWFNDEKQSCFNLKKCSVNIPYVYEYRALNVF